MINFESLYNFYEGETGLVIGNGKSLKDVPREFLCKYVSFGANRIYLLDGFQPDYYVCINPLVMQQFGDEIRKMECLGKFIRQEFARENEYGLVSMPMKTFSFNPAAYVYEGFTVTYVSLQLAYFMGFSTVLLVGVDHCFDFEGQPNEQHEMQGDDPNHFHPDYFKGAQWNNPDLEQSEEAYGLAKTAFERDGRRIINLTPNTGEIVFEKGDLEEWK